MKKEVLVVGVPRCGTTYVFRSILGLPQGDGTPKGEEYKRLPALKAHSLAPPESFGDPYADPVWEYTLNGGKTIFLFGDPILAVASTVRKRFDWVHARNCGCFLPLDQINLYEKDYFNYERMFDSWMGTDRCKVLCLKYEKLPQIQKLGIVESFLGRRIRWLPWFQRQTNYQILFEEEKKKLMKTYQSLWMKYLNAPDVVVRNL